MDFGPQLDAHIEPHIVPKGTLADLPPGLWPIGVSDQVRFLLTDLIDPIFDL